MTTSTSAKTCLASMSTSHVHRSGMTYPTLGEAERSTTFPATPVRWHLTVRNIQICSRKMTPQPWKHLKAFCREGYRRMFTWPSGYRRCGLSAAADSRSW